MKPCVMLDFFAPYQTRCLLLDTGALYLTSEHEQPIPTCRLLHTYGIAVFLATFILTLLSITVSLRDGGLFTEAVRTTEQTGASLYANLLSRARCSWRKPAASTGGS